MRKCYGLIAVSLLSLSYICWAQPYRFANDMQNHIELYGGVGYSALFDNYREINTIGSVGASIGVDYEFRVSGFWLSIGMEMQLINGLSSFAISGTDTKLLDTSGVPVLYHYNFDKGRDVQNYVFSNIPVILGYYYYGFYVGAGVKVGYSIYSKESTLLQYTTTGTYKDYIDDFKEMGNHFYTTYDVDASVVSPNKMKIAVIGEIGYDILSFYRKQYYGVTSGLKISAYIEYGLNNLSENSKDLPLYTIDTTNPSRLHVQPFYYSRDAATHIIHPFYVGVKLSWSWCIKTKTCNCDQNHRYFNKRYKNMQL